MDKKHYGSVFNNEQKLLKALLELHNNKKPIELDPMFNKGSFYKDGIELPYYKFDINPQGEIRQGQFIGTYGIINRNGYEI